jgi:hypothetical protein
MPFLALAIALLLAGPVYGGDCSGTAPNDLCEAEHPSLTASGLTSSGQTADGTGTVRQLKPSRSPKVHSAISGVASTIEVRRSTESTPAGLNKLSTTLLRVNEVGEIQVYVVLTEWSPEHVAALEALGLRVEATVPTRRLIQGWVASHALEDVAALDAVKEVKPPAYGMRQGAGAVNTPGVLTGTAVDLGPPGFDFTYGFGRADAFQALAFVSAAPNVTVGLSLNRHSVGVGDSLRIDLIEGNSGTATSQDIYFGYVAPPALSSALGCPAGDGLVLFADAFTRTVVLCYFSAPSTAFAPLFTNRAIPTAEAPRSIANITFTWPTDGAGGIYMFAVFATPPGAFADGNFGATDITSVATVDVPVSP